MKIRREPSKPAPLPEGGPAPVEAKARRLPQQPGVYLFKDAKGRVVYVGKAKALRSRVLNYFRPGSGDDRVWLDYLVPRIHDVDTFVTDTEAEAFILENTLIKDHKPKYNIRLKDDKSYLSLKLTTHTFPRLVATREIRKDGARYFGPYASAGAARQTLQLINTHFLLRECTDAVFRDRTRPCLYYQLHRCLAPCVDYESPPEYAEHVQDVVLMLKGRNTELVDHLRRKMDTASAALEFERAAKLRDQVHAVERTVEQQKVESHFGADQDVFGVGAAAGDLEVHVLLIRHGRLLTRETYRHDGLRQPATEVFESLLHQYYAPPRYVPREVLLPALPEDAPAFTEFLTARRGSAVSVHVPGRGTKRRLLDLAGRNAESALAERQTARLAEADVLEQVQRRLRLNRAPYRIECFDVSNIQGRQPVASMVVFEAGQPKKADYRHYTIRAPESPNDYLMMAEVLTRRFRRFLKDGGPVPDLLMIDGGKGHMNIAVEVLNDLGITYPDVCGIAKERIKYNEEGKVGEKDADHIFRPGRKDAVHLRPGSAPLQLLMRVRDEAHRFAITHHRRLRQKQNLRSLLDEIPGVGPKRRKQLLTHFGSLKRVKHASPEDLAAAPGISTTLAQDIWQFLHRESAPQAQ